MINTINEMMKNMCKSMILDSYGVKFIIKSGSKIEKEDIETIKELIDPYLDMVEYMSEFTKKVVLSIDNETEKEMSLEYLKKLLDDTLLNVKKVDTKSEEDNTEKTESEEESDEDDKPLFDIKDIINNNTDKDDVKLYLKLVKDVNGYPVTFLEKCIQERGTTLKELCDRADLSVDAVKKVLFDANNKRQVSTLYIDAIGSVSREVLGIIIDDFIDYEGSIMSALIGDGKYHEPNIRHLIRHYLKHDDEYSEIKNKATLILEKLEYNSASTTNKNKISLKDAETLADYMGTDVFDIFVVSDATK